MITIISLANDPIYIDSNTLDKANLNGVNLHRALLSNIDA
jgi:uncharacterized protein YjbI with pentapeptide repeats